MNSHISFPNLLPQVGFDAGNGVDFHNFEESQTADILDIAMDSFHYRIDTGSIADIQPEGIRG